MEYFVRIKITNSSEITIKLDDSLSPKTVADFIKRMPFTVSLNVWGDEIYTSDSPIVQPEENPKSPVNLYDVAYWPSGRAICLFYGPTPIGKPGEITPASPVNIIGKILSPDKSVLDEADGKTATFSPDN